jgi:hypothetical protein
MKTSGASVGFPRKEKVAEPSVLRVFSTLHGLLSPSEDGCAARVGALHFDLIRHRGTDERATI